MWIKSLRIGAIVGIIAFAGVSITGDVQAKLMFEQQPMKMASAEAACHDGTEFSVLTIADPASNDCDGVQNIFEIPGLLSFLANGDFDTPVHGVTTRSRNTRSATAPISPMTRDTANTPVSRSTTSRS